MATLKIGIMGTGWPGRMHAGGLAEVQGVSGAEVDLAHPGAVGAQHRLMSGGGCEKDLLVAYAIAEVQHGPPDARVADPCAKVEARELA